MTVASYILSAQETPLQRRAREVRCMVCLRKPTIRAGVSHPLIHSLSESVNLPTYTDLSSSANTRYRVIIIVAGHVSSSFCCTGVRCSVWGSSLSGNEAQFASGSSDDTKARGLCFCLCGALIDAPSFFVGQSFLLKELKHSSYGFYVLSLSRRPCFHPFVASEVRFSRRVL